MPAASRACCSALPLVLDHVETLQQARTELQQGEYDVILTEAALPDGNWLDALHLAREYPRDVEVIVTDPQADARFWAEALNLGAYDLLTQPFYEPEVRRILYNACSAAMASVDFSGRQLVASHRKAAAATDDLAGWS